MNKYNRRKSSTRDIMAMVNNTLLNKIRSQIIY